MNRPVPRPTSENPHVPPTRVPPATFVARTPTDLVALVPVVLGFHPQDSVVLLTFGPPGGAFHARVDLPVQRAEQEDVARVLVSAVTSNRVGRVAVLLYTDDVEAARSQGEVLLGRLLALEVEVIDVVRVDDGRWHSLPEDGAPGTAYDLESHPFTAQHVFAGRRVHRDRSELADTLVGTDEDDAVAVALAATRFADLVAATGAMAGTTAGTTAAFLAGEGRWVQRRVRQRLADGRPLQAAEAGRLLVLASLVPTRDVAWSEISREDAEAHVELWRELVRRAPRDLLPGASSLLAFAAWQQGDGALAWCALDRCLEVDPDYSMAHCVADILGAAIPPGLWEQIAETDLPVFSGAASGRRREEEAGDGAGGKDVGAGQGAEQAS